MSSTVKPTPAENTANTEQSEGAAESPHTCENRGHAHALVEQSLADAIAGRRKLARAAGSAYRNPGPLRDACAVLEAAHDAAADVYEHALELWRQLDARKATP